MPLFDPDELAAWCGGQWTGRPGGPIRRIWQNGRDARPGDLYVALRGPRFDGHEFLGQAFSAGAAAALVDRNAGPVRRGAAGPLLETDDPAAALAALARGHRRRLSGTIVGITGSVGKTGVKNLAAAALSAAGPTARTPGNWNNSIGLPLSLLGMDPQDRFGVFEIGMSRPGEIRALSGLMAPHWAALTPIGPVHIEFFESEQAIAREKAGLLEALPPDGLAVLGADDPWFGELRARVPCRLVTVHAGGGPADYSAAPDPGGARVREPGGFERVYPVRLPGEPGRAATVRAVALAREAGAPPGVIAEALSRADSGPMRWQCSTVAGVVWINDAYNANPLSLRAALEMFESSETAPRKWLALGGMAELGAASDAAHREAGRRIATGPWAGLIACGPRASILARAAAGAGMNADRILECNDAGDAAAALADRLRPGDAVLLKGSRAERMEDVLEAWRRIRERSPR